MRVARGYRRFYLALVSIFVQKVPADTYAFLRPGQPVHYVARNYFPSNHLQRSVLSASKKEIILREEARVLFEKAQTLRQQIPKDNNLSNDVPKIVAPSKWTVQDDSINGVGYRLYISIGREDGTWMDPRWGASARRIELTLDVQFISDPNNENSLANRDLCQRMVQDNFGGIRSPVYIVKTATAARLRNGFDEMKTCCGDAAYRIDTVSNRGRIAASTIRFIISTEGTSENDSSYGDIFVPRGYLYFSLPVFGGVQQLSKKEGVVSVRQIGWHTGWRRLESRIVGTFRAVPIDDAKRRDGF
jgi:hypothetical protein